MARAYIARRVVETPQSSKQLAFARDRRVSAARLSADTKAAPPPRASLLVVLRHQSSAECQYLLSWIFYSTSLRLISYNTQYESLYASVPSVEIQVPIIERAHEIITVLQVAVHNAKVEAIVLRLYPTKDALAMFQMLDTIRLSVNVAANS